MVGDDHSFFDIFTFLCYIGKKSLLFVVEMHCEVKILYFCKFAVYRKEVAAKFQTQPFYMQKCAKMCKNTQNLY